MPSRSKKVPGSDMFALQPEPGSTPPHNAPSYRAATPSASQPRPPLSSVTLESLSPEDYTALFIFPLEIQSTILASMASDISLMSYQPDADDALYDTSHDTVEHLLERRISPRKPKERAIYSSDLF